MSFVTKTWSNVATNGWDKKSKDLNMPNGNNLSFDKSESQKKKNSTTIIRILRDELQINEWTFSLFLFCFSLSIVVGKLFINYGEALKWQMEFDNYKFTSSLPVAFPSIMTNLSSISLSLKPTRLKFNGDRLMKVGENLLNVSQRYEEAFSDAVKEFSIQNWVWIRAALSGISMMGFTWYIIYKDSSVPGVNPPSPLSLSRKRGQSRFSMQINYFVGVLNGILIFIYLIL